MSVPLLPRPTVTPLVGRLHGHRAVAELEKVLSSTLPFVPGAEAFNAPVAICAFGDCELCATQKLGGLINLWSLLASASDDGVFTVARVSELWDMITAKQLGFAFSSTPQMRLFFQHAEQSIGRSYFLEGPAPPPVTPDPYGQAILVAALARLGAHPPMLLAGSTTWIVCVPKESTPWKENQNVPLLGRMVASVASLQILLLPETGGGFLNDTVIMRDRLANLVKVPTSADRIAVGVLPAECCEALMLFDACVQIGWASPGLARLVDTDAATAALLATGDADLIALFSIAQGDVAGGPTVVAPRSPSSVAVLNPAQSADYDALQEENRRLNARIQDLLVQLAAAGGETSAADDPYGAYFDALKLFWAAFVRNRTETLTPEEKLEFQAQGLAFELVRESLTGPAYAAIASVFLFLLNFDSFEPLDDFILTVPSDPLRDQIISVLKPATEDYDDEDEYEEALEQYVNLIWGNKGWEFVPTQQAKMADNGKKSQADRINAITRRKEEQEQAEKDRLEKEAKERDAREKAKADLIPDSKAYAKLMGLTEQQLTNPNHPDLQGWRDARRDALDGYIEALHAVNVQDERFEEYKKELDLFKDEQKEIFQQASEVKKQNLQFRNQHAKRVRELNQRIDEGFTKRMDPKELSRLMTERDLLEPKVLEAIDVSKLPPEAPDKQTAENLAKTAEGLRMAYMRIAVPNGALIRRAAKWDQKNPNNPFWTRGIGPFLKSKELQVLGTSMDELRDVSMSAYKTYGLPSVKEIAIAPLETSLAEEIKYDETTKTLLTDVSELRRPTTVNQEGDGEPSDPVPDVSREDVGRALRYHLTFALEQREIERQTNETRRKLKHEAKERSEAAKLKAVSVDVKRLDHNAVQNRRRREHEAKEAERRGEHLAKVQQLRIDRSKKEIQRRANHERNELRLKASYGDDYEGTEYVPVPFAEPKFEPIPFEEEEEFDPDRPYTPKKYVPLNTKKYEVNPFGAGLFLTNVLTAIANSGEWKKSAAEIAEQKAGAKAAREAEAQARKDKLNRQKAVRDAVAGTNVMDAAFEASASGYVSTFGSHLLRLLNMVAAPRLEQFEAALRLDDACDFDANRRLRLHEVHFALMQPMPTGADFLEELEKKREQREARAKAIESGELKVEDPREKRLREAREQAEKEKEGKKKAKAAAKATPAPAPTPPPAPPSAPSPDGNASDDSSSVDPRAALQKAIRARGAELEEKDRKNESGQPKFEDPREKRLQEANEAEAASKAEKKKKGAESKVVTAPVQNWRTLKEAGNVSLAAFATREAYDGLVEDRHKREALQRHGYQTTLFDAVAALVRAKLGGQ